MSEFVQIGKFEIPQAELLPLLGRYQLIPIVWRELIVDAAIGGIECSATEIAAAIAQFRDRHKLESSERLQQWLALHGVDERQMGEIAVRQAKIERFKQLTFDPKVATYFLQRKQQLDQAIYSLIRTTSPEIAQEIYFRTSAGEQTFAQAATKYSEGAEALTGGTIGPVELSVPHPAIASLIATQPLGQVCAPVKIDRWYAIVRPERLLPARLDESMRLRLREELFHEWLTTAAATPQSPTDPPLV